MIFSSVKYRAADAVAVAFQNSHALKRSSVVISKALLEVVSLYGFRDMKLGFQNKYNRFKPKPYSAVTMDPSKTSSDGKSVWWHSSRQS